MPESIGSRPSVAPTLDVPLGSGSVVFCATMALAWQQLAKAANQHPLRLAGDPPLAASLGAARVSEEDLDPRSYVARWGTGEEGLRAIREALLATFGPDVQTGLLPEHLLPNQLLAYAHLLKNLFFAVPFAPGDEGGMVFAGGPRVRYFDLGSARDDKRAARAKQVIVHDHRSDEDFVLELATRDPDDRLIAARVAPRSTLGDTVRHVLERAAGSPSIFRRMTGDAQLRPDEPMRIPLVQMDEEVDFESLVGRRVLGTDWTVRKATQAVRFRLDETGARLESGAAILAERGGPVAKRRFVFDGPFLILLARRGRSTPYLAAWIAGGEALCRALPAS